MGLCIAVQFKWPVPEETGGFTELTYTLELFPPPNLEAQVSQLPEVDPCAFSSLPPRSLTPLAA